MASAVAILGVVLLLLVLVDVIWTTLSTHGAGPVTSMVTSVVWLSFSFIHSKIGLHRLQKVNVVVILISVFWGWIFLLWSGWFLVFVSGEFAVVVAATGEPALLRDRVYFVGMTIFTLGTGDFVAAGTFWRLLMAIASLSGLVMITLAITYLLPVMSAGMERRQIALTIWSLGQNGEEILQNGWNGKDFSLLNSPFEKIASKLIINAERHLAYPVLQYFHAADPRADLVPRAASLNEALLLLEVGISQQSQLSKTALRNLRIALDRYLHRMEFLHIPTSKEAPPLPDLKLLEELDIPMRAEKSIKDGFDDHAEQRKRLYGSLQSVGWNWGE